MRDQQRADQDAQSEARRQGNGKRICPMRVMRPVNPDRTAGKLAQKAMKMGAEAENFFWKGKVEKALAEWPKR